MKKVMAAMCLGLLLVCATGAEASIATNLITNGDFEQGTTLAPNSWTIVKSLPGWTSGTSPKEIEVQYGLGWAQPGVTNINQTHYVELDANNNVKMRQSVLMEKGSTYTLSFDYFNRTKSDSSGVDVKIGSRDILKTDVISSEWIHITKDFTWNGKSGSKVFSLIGTGGSDSLGAYIDNVSLTKHATTPIPGAALLLGSGLAGLVGLKRRKRQA